MKGPYDLFMTIDSRHLKNYLSKIRVTMSQSLKHNLRKDFLFVTGNVKSLNYASESISFLGPILCDVLPKNIKDINLANVVFI